MSFCGALGTLASIFILVLGFRNYRSTERFVFLSGILLLGWWIFSLSNLFARESTDTTTKSALRILLYGIPFLGLAIPTKSTLIKGFFQKHLNFFILAGLIPSLCVAFYQFFIDQSPAFGLMKNTNYFAYGLLPPLAFGIFSFRNFDKNSGLAIAGLCLMGIFLSLSRGAILAAIVFSSWQGLQFFWKTRHKKVFLILAASMMLAAPVAVYFSPVAREKIERSFSGEDPSWHWRIVAWKHNLNLFIDSPFFGVGYEQNGIDTFKQPHLAGHWGGGTRIFAHNLFIQTLADSGLVGFVLLFGFLILLGFQYPAALPLLGLTAFAGLLENTFTNSRSFHPFLFYLFLILSIERIAQLNSPRSPKTPKGFV